jgi:hypothetical protein
MRRHPSATESARISPLEMSDRLNSLASYGLGLCHIHCGEGIASTRAHTSEFRRIDRRTPHGCPENSSAGLSL